MYEEPCLKYNKNPYNKNPYNKNPYNKNPYASGTDTLNIQTDQSNYFPRQQQLLSSLITPDTSGRQQQQGAAAAASLRLSVRTPQDWWMLCEIYLSQQQFQTLKDVCNTTGLGICQIRPNPYFRDQSGLVTILTALRNMIFIEAGVNFDLKRSLFEDHNAVIRNQLGPEKLFNIFFEDIANPYTKELLSADARDSIGTMVILYLAGIALLNENSVADIFGINNDFIYIKGFLKASLLTQIKKVKLVMDNEFLYPNPIRVAFKKTSLGRVIDKIEQFIRLIILNDFIQKPIPIGLLNKILIISFVQLSLDDTSMYDTNSMVDPETILNIFKPDNFSGPMKDKVKAVIEEESKKHAIENSTRDLSDLRKEIAKIQEDIIENRQQEIDEQQKRILAMLQDRLDKKEKDIAMTVSTNDKITFGSGMGIGDGVANGTGSTNLGTGLGNSLGTGLGNSLGTGLGNSLGTGLGNSLGTDLGSSLKTGMGTDMVSNLGTGLGTGIGRTIGI
jgi:hypothetical protein